MKKSVGRTGSSIPDWNTEFYSNRQVEKVKFQSNEQILAHNRRKIVLSTICLCAGASTQRSTLGGLRPVGEEGKMQCLRYKLKNLEKQLI